MTLAITTVMGVAAVAEVATSQTVHLLTAAEEDFHDELVAIRDPIFLCLRGPSDLYEVKVQDPCVKLLVITILVSTSQV